MYNDYSYDALLKFLRKVISFLQKLKTKKIIRTLHEIFLKGVIIWKKEKKGCVGFILVKVGLLLLFWKKNMFRFTE